MSLWGISREKKVNLSLVSSLSPCQQRGEMLERQRQHLLTYDTGFGRFTSSTGWTCQFSASQGFSRYITIIHSYAFVLHSSRSSSNTSFSMPLLKLFEIIENILGFGDHDRHIPQPSDSASRRSSESRQFYRDSIHKSSITVSHPFVCLFVQRRRALNHRSLSAEDSREKRLSFIRLLFIHPR